MWGIHHTFTADKIYWKKLYWEKINIDTINWENVFDRSTEYK